METRTGYLTIFSPDRTQVYGEIPDATWQPTQTEGGLNHVLSGRAGDGVKYAFNQLNTDGVSHVAYTFETEGSRYAGDAELLAPDGFLIQIETGQSPRKE